MTNGGDIAGGSAGLGDGDFADEGGGMGDLAVDMEARRMVFVVSVMAVPGY